MEFLLDPIDDLKAPAYLGLPPFSWESDDDLELFDLGSDTEAASVIEAQNPLETEKIPEIVAALPAKSKKKKSRRRKDVPIKKFVRAIRAYYFEILSNRKYAVRKHWRPLSYFGEEL